MTALAIMLLGESYERAHYAFSMASTAAALGRDAMVFAAGKGTRALLRDGGGLIDGAEDSAHTGAGVVGLAEIRDACVELGVRLTACEAAVRLHVPDTGAFLESVQVMGLASFLADTAGAQMVVL